MSSEFAPDTMRNQKRCIGHRSPETVSSKNIAGGGAAPLVLIETKQRSPEYRPQTQAQALGETHAAPNLGQVTLKHCMHTDPSNSICFGSDDHVHILDQHNLMSNASSHETLTVCTTGRRYLAKESVRCSCKTTALPFCMKPLQQKSSTRTNISSMRLARD